MLYTTNTTRLWSDNDIHQTQLSRALLRLNGVRWLLCSHDHFLHIYPHSPDRAIKQGKPSLLGTRTLHNTSMLVMCAAETCSMCLTRTVPSRKARGKARSHRSPFSWHISSRVARSSTDAVGPHRRTGKGPEQGPHRASARLSLSCIKSCPGSALLSIVSYSNHSSCAVTASLRDPSCLVLSSVPCHFESSWHTYVDFRCRRWSVSGGTGTEQLTCSR